MSDEPLQHYFLLLYDRDTRRLEAKNVGTDPKAAGLAYDRSERDIFAKHVGKRIEVVLVSADSLDTIRKTHSHYFSDEESDDGLFNALAARR